MAMKLIKWLDAYELGHYVIDRGHKDIVDALNSAITAFNDRNTEACIAALNLAVDETRRHFSQEEAVLFSFGLRHNGLKHHAAHHDRLLAEVEKIAALCKKDPRRESLESRIAEFVHFIVYEIKGCDREFKDCLSSTRMTA